MQQLKFKLDRHSLETIYFSFIRPTIEYADCIWYGSHDSDLDKLDRIQIDAMRIVSGATARSNINNLYEELAWPSLHERRLKHSLCMMYKIVNGEAPPYLLDLLPTTVGNRSEYTTKLRSAHNIDDPLAKNSLQCLRRSFFPRTIREWNSIDHNTRNAQNLKSFKSLLSADSNAENSLFYYGQRWPCIHHARMRMGCSKLNYHLFNNHLVLSPACSCGYHTEDPTHFLLNCPNYAALRLSMLNIISPLCRISTASLLYGDKGCSPDVNIKIFDEVHKFILLSNRFD